MQSNRIPGITILLMLSCMLAGCQSGSNPNLGDKKTSGSQLIGGDGAFTVPVPLMNDPHVKQQDSIDYGAIICTGAFGTLYRLEYQRIAPSDRAGFDQGRKVSGLAPLFENSVMPLFRSISNDTQVLTRENVSYDNQTAFFAAATISNASVAMVDRGQGAKREEDVRGVLIFTRGDYLFFAMHSDPLALGPDSIQSDQHIAKLKKDLMEFANTIKMSSR